MAEDLTELRGEGWKRLLAAARHSLEQTGGALDWSIGLSSPTEHGTGDCAAIHSLGRNPA